MAVPRQEQPSPGTSDLAGKVAVVTGAASGIGRASAILFARHGAKVVLADVTDNTGRDLAAEIEKSGGAAEYVHSDVTQDEDCAAMVAAAVKRFGRLDFAFNNAGIVEKPPALMTEMLPSTWRRVLDVNLTGVFNCMRHEARAMWSTGGAIVNTSSLMGQRGTVGGAAYCASKHGVIGLTRAAALEFGRNGIRVNVVLPGYIATPMTIGEGSVFSQEQLDAGIRTAAIRRLADPAEVAEMVVWLCSSRASFVTGGCFSVDGGAGAA